MPHDCASLKLLRTVDLRSKRRFNVFSGFLFFKGRKRISLFFKPMQAGLAIIFSYRAEHRLKLGQLGQGSAH